jgi:ribosomal protein L37AE/L43A
MRGSSRAASRPDAFVCPVCEAGRLDTREAAPVRCGSCGSLIGGGVLGLLAQITALPDALGAHACDCGHPEMKLLPDGVYRCPGCGSEVEPVAADRSPREGKVLGDPP